ncbi:TPA: hypothetical protein ACH3X3_004966 [Trebouxia sp. C0006]
MSEQQQQDPSDRPDKQKPSMQQLAAAALAQVVLCRNRGLLTSSCLSAQKRRRVSKIKEDGGGNLSVQGVRHTPPKLVKQTKRGSSSQLSVRASKDTLDLHAPKDCNVTVEQGQADQQDTPCSLDRYSCLAEVLQYAVPSAAPSMPGIRCHSIAQAGRHPPGAPTRKLPSNMWDSAFIADNKHLSSRWSVQLHEIRNPLIADPITSTNGLLLRLESARTGSLSSRALAPVVLTQAHPLHCITVAAGHRCSPAT